MSDSGTPESHGVHGAPRENGRMQEEPTGADEPGRPVQDAPVDGDAKAEQTETGGDAT